MDDEILRKLGNVAAEQERESCASPYEALLRRELPSAAADELEARAREDEDVARALSAYRPLDDARIDAIALGLASRARPIRTSRRVRALLATSSALAAAALVALVTRSSGFRGARESAEPAALPVFVLEASGASSMRGGTGGAATADPSCVLPAAAAGFFELVVRAEEPPEGPIAARVFLVRDAAIVPWAGAMEIDGGSVRVIDAAARLLGATELRIVVGRPEVIGRAAELAEREEPSGAGFQLLRCAIVER
jgi:hypothetical protein